MGLAPAELDDFVQEVVTRVYRNRGRWTEVRLFPQWMAGIARNTAREWRGERLPQLMEDVPDIPDASWAWTRREHSDDEWVSTAVEKWFSRTFREGRTFVG